MISGMNSMMRESDFVGLKDDFTGWSKRDLILYRLLFFIPLINAAADSTIYYFVNVNTSGELHPGIIRGFVILLYLMFFGFRRLLKHPVNNLILFLLTYFLILSLLSSNVTYSISSGYIKWFVGLMMFPVGFYFIRSYDSIVRLIFYMVIGSSFVCLNLTVAQFTGFGISAYVDDSFYIGGAGVGITNQLAYVLLLYPVILRARNRFSRLEKWMIYFIGFLSVVFIILAMKRAGLIALAGGGLIYFNFTRNKRKVLKYVGLSAVLFLLILPLFKDILVDRYNERVEQTKELENENRYKEFFYVLDEFEGAGVPQKLFGNELFNTGKYFGVKYFDRERMIHGDISAFIYGSGLLGISTYLFLFILLLDTGLHFLRRFRRVIFVREILASFFSLLFATFLVSVTGSGTIGERCLVYLYMGAVIGVCSRIKIKSKATE